MSISELPLEVRSINDVVSIGDPIYRMSPILPSPCFDWMTGQEFDVLEYTELAKVYPSGKLPDPRWYFFKVVDVNSGGAGEVVGQSVQHLEFVGDELPVHGHTRKEAKTGSGTHSEPMGGSGVGGRAINTAIPITAGTPTGKIIGTSDKTAPDHMQVYCMTRIK